MSDFHPWSGVLAKVNLLSHDNRVLVLPPDTPLRHRDLPLPLTLDVDLQIQDRACCGQIDKVWEENETVWATGVIDVDTEAEWGQRLLDRSPQPIAINVAGGTLGWHNEKWWHPVERLRGRDTPRTLVRTDWTVTSATLVQRAAWPDAFITLDDD